MNALEPGELRRRFIALGFDDVRVARVGPGGAPGAAELAEWVAAGHHADMQWMERTVARRGDPELVLPGARSIIMLGVNYWSERRPRSETGSAGPVWARYSLYSDYHDTVRAALVEAGRALEELCAIGPADYRYYVDTGPVLERGWASRSGLGFTGKNAMLISPRFGNWLFLAGILTRAELVPDEPLSRRPARDPTDGVSATGRLCGKCTRCLDACPTDAFSAPGVVDARRCISYQTIENRGIIPRELRAGIGNRIFGCDICLEVCPWNRFAQEGRRVILSARDDVAEFSLRELLAMTREQFSRTFRGTAIKRLKWAGLLRNACIVAGNTGAADCVDLLLQLAAESPPLVRAHAVWALARLGAGAQLAVLRDREEDPLVRSEYDAVDGLFPA